MTQEEMAKVMDEVFDECRALRKAGQAEYAGADRDAFTNFDKLAEDFHVRREMVLMIYAKKHYDGIINYINGHRSQREDVRGRINDLIVYMCLLRGMIDEKDRTARTLSDPYAPRQPGAFKMEEQ